MPENGAYVVVGDDRFSLMHPSLDFSAVLIYSISRKSLFFRAVFQPFYIYKIQF
jgi:hypothetical protein